MDLAIKSLCVGTTVSPTAQQLEGSRYRTWLICGNSKACIFSFGPTWNWFEDAQTPSITSQNWKYDGSANVTKKSCTVYTWKYKACNSNQDSDTGDTQHWYLSAGLHQHQDAPMRVISDSTTWKKEKKMGRWDIVLWCKYIPNYLPKQNVCLFSCLLRRYIKEPY